jgi:hypothetical protein
VTPLTWPSPLPGGGTHEEYALAFDQFRRWRLLIVPALFDEANRMRRFTVEVMRRLDGAGVDSFLIDLPGCNESLAPLEQQTPESWREAVRAAAKQFRASHVLGLRGGALLAPPELPCWRYAPVKGATILRNMLRARIFTAREAGIDETQEGLTEAALAQGIELAGFRLGAEFVRQFQSLTPPVSVLASEVEQDMLGGSGLWLRAEPGEDRDQADALAAIIAIGIKS